MLTAAILCATLLAADEPASVEVRLVSRSTDEKPTEKVDPWIVMAVTKSSEEYAVPWDGWVKLTPKQGRIHTSNGCYIDGRVVEKKGKLKIKIEGCNGGEIKMTAKLSLGERGVFRLEGYVDVFVAVRTLKPKK